MPWPDDALPPCPAATEILRASPIFRRGSDEDLALLARDTHWVEHAAGEDLVRQGDPADAPLLIARVGPRCCCAAKAAASTRSTDCRPATRSA